MTQILVKLNPDTPPTGSDLSIVNAARRSFNTRSEWDWYSWEDLSDPKTPPEHEMKLMFGSFRALKPKDKRLIQFLARGMTADDFEALVSHAGCYGYNIENLPDPAWKVEQQLLVELLWQWRNTPTHSTPFNHCFISFEVKAPIFVRAQLVKHEYLIMSEFSRRYITDDIEFYEPDYWRKAAPDKKQGSLEEDSGFTLDPGFNNEVVAEYQNMVQSGVAPEQARMILPQSTMTEWTHSGTLGAFAKLCRLRLHKDAQYECRLVAEQIYKHLLEHYPVSAKALVEGPDL